MQHKKGLESIHTQQVPEKFPALIIIVLSSFAKDPTLHLKFQNSFLAPTKSKRYVMELEARALCPVVAIQTGRTSMGMVTTIASAFTILNAIDLNPALYRGIPIFPIEQRTQTPMQSVMHFSVVG